MIALMGIAACAMMACNNNNLDSKLSDYEKACNGGKVEEAAKIATEIAKDSAKFTPEQKKKWENAEKVCKEKENAKVKTNVPGGGAAKDTRAME